MIKVKICGVKSFENALMVAEAGADFIGLNFYPPSPRYLDLDCARAIARQLRIELGTRCPKLVGVFVNAPVADMQETLCHVDLDYAQLSGDELANMIDKLGGRAFKAIRPQTAIEALDLAKRFAMDSAGDSASPSLLLDGYNPALYGGTGELAAADLALALKRRVPRLMLAGGLNPDNVAERVRLIQPWGVDVASGVEAGVPGLKDEVKVRDFIAAARTAS